MLGDENEVLKKVLKPNALVAVESAKFFLPLPKTAQKQEYLKKVDELTGKLEFSKIPGMCIH